MEGGQIASNTLAKESTAIDSISKDVIRLTEYTSGIEQSLSGLKYRLLGLQDEAAPETDAPEPVRQDIEELNFRLARLEHILGQIDHHQIDLNRL